MATLEVAWHMKSLRCLLAMLIAFFICGCSGFRPGISKGRVVSARHVARFRGTGSISTLWYRGSDKNYHYFAHYVKVSTFYRVPRSGIRLPDEFPYQSRQPVFVGHLPIWESLLKQPEHSR